ncbi:TetR/AcrR family transcriptional regulator [Micromonospora siamensis]|uniref:TetR/AcrR family transcriptional regulator n=1 Tax=Micromonospora siamensis TaxID=299152 RepID=UPI0018D52B0B|nr:TetR/AcrR family transcriptional regulator [Micromonospora siamensis]
MGADGRRRRLSAEDWARAALEMIGEQGLAGVAVEPLAVRLGTTKGSFYWHFANRDALVTAALARWEREHTEGVIEALGAPVDPAAALRQLFASTTTTAAAGRLHVRVEVNLLAAAGDPLVAPAVHRVVRRRVDYLRTLFEDLGFDADEAARRALLAYSTHVGHLQLMVRMPELVPDGRADQLAYLDTVIGVVTPPRNDSADR